MRRVPPLMPLSRAVLNVSPISTVARPFRHQDKHDEMLRSMGDTTMHAVRS